MSTITAPPRVAATVAGSNRKHELSRADWRFLLPALGGRRVLALGAPSRGEMRALCAEASLVVVACGARTAQQAAGSVSLDRLCFVIADTTHGLPFPADTFDCVIFFAAVPLWQLAAPPPAHRDLDRVLTRDAAVYLPTRVPAGAAWARRWATTCLGPAAAVRSYWTVFRQGTMRAAIPTESAAALAPFFFRSALYGRSRRGRWLAAAARALAAARVLHRIMPRRGTTITRGAICDVPFPFLSGAAPVTDFDLPAAGTGLLTNGSFDSNKVAFFAFDAGAARPAVVVKATRTREFNGRLEREFRGLRTVCEHELAAPGSVPVPLYFGTHDGLAVLAQRAIDGVPFRFATSAAPDCPAARRAIDWILQLAERSAAPAADNRLELCDRFDGMLVELSATYRISAHDADFLRQRIEELRRSAAPLPLVFRHGDAGSWNIMIRPDGSVAFLDWEISEEAGPPLWDMIDFARSHVSWMSRMRGTGDAVASFRQLLDHDGADARLFNDAIRRAADAAGLSRCDIEPLFYFYWVDRALRQAAWSTTASLADASFLRILRSCIERRDSVVLRDLFDTTDPARTDAAVQEQPAFDSDAQLAVLRHADWRFLLPSEMPAKAALVGSERSDIAASLALVCRTVDVLDTDTPADGDTGSRYPLVVVDHPTTAALRRAMAAAQPGGMLYVEADRRASRARPVPTGLRFGDHERRLAALGADAVQMHWHYPNFERCRAIIPATALEHGIRHLRRGGDKPALAVLATLLRIPGAGRLVRRLLPCTSYVVRMPAARPEVRK